MQSNLRNVVGLLKIMNEIRLTGGVSYNINTQELNPVEGYMVALPCCEQTVQTIDDETVRDFILKHSEHFAKPNTYFGCWFDGVDYILDVSEWYERKRDALFHALYRNQEAIWDCAAKDEIAVNRRGSLVKQYISIDESEKQTT